VEEITRETVSLNHLGICSRQCSKSN